MGQFWGELPSLAGDYMVYGFRGLLLISTLQFFQSPFSQEQDSQPGLLVLSKSL